MIKVYSIKEYLNDSENLADLIKRAKKIFKNTCPSERDVMLRLKVSRFTARKILEFLCRK